MSKNNKQINSTFLGLTFVCLFFTSCTEPIDLDLNSSHIRLVVEGRITDEFKQHQVDLTLTSDYFSNKEAPRATGATVNIEDDLGNTYDLVETQDGVYVSDSLSFPHSRTYTLKINYENEEYTATTFMPPVTVLDSITIEWWEDHEHYHVNINTFEPVGLGDYYEWQIYLNNNLDNDTLFEIEFADDQFVDGNYIPNIHVYSFDTLFVGDTIRVDQMSLTKESYDFYIATLLESVWRGGPFDGPPANVETNVSNGALGFFMASSVSTSIRVFDE